MEQSESPSASSISTTYFEILPRRWIMSEPGVAGRPIVGVVSDQVDLDGVNTNMVRTRYLEAMALTAGVTPVVLATNLANSDLEALIAEHLDGVLLTGSASN